LEKNYVLLLKQINYFVKMSRNNHLAYGLFNNYKFSSKFGNLEVPAGMRPVSDFRQQGDMLIMPFGPPGAWITERDQGAGSSGVVRFGNNTLTGRKVTPAGYMSTWNGMPVVPPPSWNPLLHQGGNTFVTNPNSPSLSDIVASFGRRSAVASQTLSKKKTVTHKKKTTASKKKGVKKSQGCGFGKKKKN
jgi:hypothetical protein